MPAYQKSNTSSTVDTFTAGNISINGDLIPSKVITFVIGKSAAYGVKTNKFTVDMVTDLTGDVATASHCKIRVEKNGNLVDEKTYVAEEVNPSYNFTADSDDEIVVTFSTNATGDEVINLIATRFVIKAGVAAACTC